MVAIGIDLGTTYSCVGWWKDNRCDIIANDQGSRTTPSYVAFTDNERLIGESAKNQASNNSANTVYDAKRLIGRKFSDPIIKNEISINPEIEVLTKELNYEDENPEIILNIGGKYINEEQINNWKLQLTNYEMGNVNLEIHNLQSKAIDEEELLNKILVDNDKKILSISEERDLYKSELQNIMREKNALD